MREILFRGKTINDIWVYGNLLCSEPSFAIADCSNRLNIICNEVFGETVGQYTGLIDKNNIKIFDGDILESRASKNEADWKRWLVVYSDGGFCFERNVTKRKRSYNDSNLLCNDEIELYGLEVIGNIYDNPELLKEAQK